MKKVLVRFPNECYFVEIQMDMDKFKPDKEFDDQIFGWYGDIYVSVKK